MDDPFMRSGKWSVKDTLTGEVYKQPNKLIAEKVAEMHGLCTVIPGWPEDEAPAEPEEPEHTLFDTIIDWTLYAEPAQHGPIRHRRG